MHVRRRMHRFFSSLMIKKSRETSESNNSGGVNKFSSFRSSLRLKRKGNSTSRCQLLDDHEEILSSDKENSVEITPFGSPAEVVPVGTWRTSRSDDHQPLEVEVDICQGAAALCADDGEDDVDKILFEDFPSRQHPPASKVMEGSGRRIIAPATGITRKDMELNSNYPKMKVNDADDRITLRPASRSHDTDSEICSACRKREEISIKTNTATSAWNGSSGNPPSQQENENQGDNLPTAAVSSTAIIKIPKKKLTLGDVRRSAKRVRKAMQVGFINWAQSMSYPYSAVVLPEFYECPPSTIDCHYSGTETPWFSQHGHYGVRDRYSQSMHANPNQICQFNL